MRERTDRMASETKLAETAGGPLVINLTDSVPTYQMKPQDTFIWVYSATGEDASGIVYLPSVMEAAGNFYSITAPTGASGNDVSVYYIEGTPAEYAGQDSDDGDLDADEDNIVLFSNGREWCTIFNGVA